MSADTAARIKAEAERIMALGESGQRAARDPVNLPIIENWVEAIGDANPVYTDADRAAASVHGGLVAPPAMTQVWTMTGQRPATGTADPTGQIVAVLEAAGYTSVVATNADHVFHRYLRHGERLYLRVALVDLIGPKQTALGEGWFFTTRHTWYSGDEAVATMDFRILKFRPKEPGAPSVVAGRPAAAQAGAGQSGATHPGAAKPGAAEPEASAGVVMRPVLSPDTRF